jgi:hypothetical protein
MQIKITERTVHTPINGAVNEERRSHPHRQSRGFQIPPHQSVGGKNAVFE